MKKLFLMFIAATFSFAAKAEQLHDMLSDETLPVAVSKGDQMRPDYNANMGQIIRAFDDGKSSSSDTVLRRSWTPDHSIAVRLRKNVGTLISLPEGERIQGFVLGDQEGFVTKLLGEKLPNQIVVSPTAFDIDTNLTIIDENNRTYSFYLRSDPKESEIVPHFLVVIELPANATKNTKIALKDDPQQSSFSSAKPEFDKVIDKAAMRSLTEKEYDFLQALQASGEVYTGYRIYGDSAIAPNAVWDDGKQVYISFRDGTPSSRLPTLYRVIDGYASIANSHYRDGFLITDSVSDEGWMLVDGNKTICIKSLPKKKLEARKKISVVQKKPATREIPNLSKSEKAAALLDNKMRAE